MQKLILLSVLLLVGVAMTQNPPADTATKFKQPVAVFVTTLGKIVVELYAKQAPLTVENFIKQARAGNFDGTTFHRVVKGFVIQGGDPNSKDDDASNDGFGGGEIGVDPRKMSNVRGTISMASSSRMQPIDTQSDVQFFINLVDNVRLDGVGFIPFGKVISGSSIVAKIALVKTGANDRPLKNVIITKITIIEKTKLPK